MLIGNIFQQTYNIVDSIIVGKVLGIEALTAVGASFPIIFSLISFVIGIASGGTIIISQYFGAKDYEKVKRAIDTMYIFVFFASLMIMAVGIGFSKSIFALIRLPEEVLPQATIYLHTFLYGTILLFGFNAISGILRGVGDSKTPLYFQIVAVVLNIFLDILFIKYLHMGIRGAALATVIAQGSAFLLAAIYLNKNHKLVRVRINKLIFDKAIFKQSVRIGLPSGFQQTFVAFGMMALFRIVNDFGTQVAAAYSVAGRIDNLALLPSMNFGQALATFVGQNLGANKLDRIRTGLKATFLMSASVSVFLTAFVIIFREQLMFLFTNDGEVVDIGIKYLIIVGSCYLLFSLMFSLNGVLRGAGDTLIPMFITLLSLWIIRIPFAYFLSGRIGEVGIWWAVPIAWGVGTVCSYVYYKTGKWKEKGVVKHAS